MSNIGYWVWLTLLVVVITATDNFPNDSHLSHLKGKYICTIYEPDGAINDNVTISLTTIPPRFSYLKDLIKYKSDLFNIIVNIPVNYKYFHQQLTPHIEGIKINIVDKDLGPGLKLLGLCNILNDVSDVIIYLDDDVDYSFDQMISITKHLKLGYMIGGHGGFYTGIDDPNLSFLGYGYFNQRYEYKPCYIDSEVLMGFGGVALYKKDLIKLCNSPLLFKYTSRKGCYFVDDDWISRLANDVGIKRITHLGLILSHDVFRSENDGWSNRAMYHQSRKDCLSNTPLSTGESGFIIKSAMIEGQQSLHKLSEYRSIKKIVRRNHYDFSNSYNHDYKLYTSTNLKKSHWAKMQIIKDFLSECDINDKLLYTDYDFLFLNNVFPIFTTGSMIMAKGCSYDNEMAMVGTLLTKCDKSLIEFIEQWIKLTSVCSDLQIKNDDQISFNLIKYDLADKLQIVDFYRYDTCDFKEPILGLHFPGGDKLSRMIHLLSAASVRTSGGSD